MPIGTHKGTTPFFIGPAIPSVPCARAASMSATSAAPAAEKTPAVRQVAKKMDRVVTSLAIELSTLEADN
jgi:hypothetical protein